MSDTESLAINPPQTHGDTNTDWSQMELTRTDSENAAGDAKRYEAGAFVGKYQIKSFLGQGGMGVVYRAFDPLVERDVALSLAPLGLLRS